MISSRHIPYVVFSCERSYSKPESDRESSSVSGIGSDSERHLFPSGLSPLTARALALTSPAGFLLEPLSQKADSSLSATKGGILFERNRKVIIATKGRTGYPSTSNLSAYRLACDPTRGESAFGLASSNLYSERSFLNRKLKQSNRTPAAAASNAKKGPSF